MIPPGTPAGQGDLEMSRALRAAFRELVTLRASPEAAHAETGTLQRVNQTFSVHLLQVQGDLGGTAALVPAGRGIPAALAALSATAALAQAVGTWHRLKMCAAPECRWVFYDTSRSGAGRWCSMRVCGNRVKTRAYRQPSQDSAD